MIVKLSVIYNHGSNKYKRIKTPIYVNLLSVTSAIYLIVKEMSLISN